MRFRYQFSYLSVTPLIIITACSTNKSAERTSVSEENCVRPQAVSVAVPVSDEPAQSLMVGGYSEQRKPTDKEIELFQNTYKGEVELTPIAMEIQVVAGINYRFLCEDKKGNNYEVVIYQPLRGEASTTSVERK